MQSKKGQKSGGAAAVLVALITLFIILYVTFLPPDQQAQVLTGAPSAGSGSFGNATLLSEQPGRIAVLDQRVITHPLPSVNLFTQTTASILYSARSGYLKNGWFDKLQTNLSFPVQNVANTNNILLSFSALEASGNLQVKLNGALIFSGSLVGFNPEPISLPKELLLESNNVVELSASSVGWRFWKTNEFQLREIKVTADITDLSTREARQVFLVTKTEKESAERAFLRFFPDCVTGTVGPLSVFLNNHNIFQAVPECGSSRTLEISPQFFLSGENSLLFKSSRGVYLVDQISLQTELIKPVYPTYYFEVDNEKIGAIRSGVPVILYLDFVEDLNRKNAQVFVNGHVLNVDTSRNQYWANINLFLSPGSNAISIIPRSTIDIVKLEVILG